MYFISNSVLAKYLWNNEAKQNFVIEAHKLQTPADYGGLGIRYYKQLTTKLDKILQVDTVSGLTETNGSVRGRGIMLALAMRELGVVQNDIIVISSRCHSEQTIVVLACLFVGAIVAPLDPEQKYIHCKNMMNKLKPKMCFCDIRTVSQMERVISDQNINSCKIINFGKNCNGTTQFFKLFTHKEYEEFTPVCIQYPKTAIAFILATQGTTGEPKLVCLSHNNMLLQTLIFLDIIGYPNKIISFFPLSWIMETILMCVCFESSVVRILPSTFKERHACKLIQDLKIDFALLSTDLAMSLIGHVAIKDFDINCLKYIMVGNTPTSKNYMQRFRLSLPKVKFIQTYPLTETGCIASTSLENYVKSCDKPGSVGRILYNSKIKIVDIESREPLGPNKPGELLFSGEGLMLGYYKDSKETIAAMEKGFFKTGDVAEYDEEGWLYIQGRIEDLIIVDGVRISPLDLENVILIHPFVRDVVVIGNEKELLACVVKKAESSLSPSKLMSFLRERLPDNLQPTKIIFLDNLPKTSIGKVKKQELRKEFFQIRIDYTESFSSVAL